MWDLLPDRLVAWLRFFVVFAGGAIAAECLRLLAGVLFGP